MTRRRLLRRCLSKPSQTWRFRMSLFLLLWVASFLLSRNTIHAAEKHHQQIRRQQGTTATTAATKQSFRMDLHPTAMYEENRRRQRRRQRRSLKATSSTTKMNDWPKWWFHNHSNAVYATIPKVDDINVDADDEEMERWNDFHTHRHLSRFERPYRMQRGMDLQIGWDGIYRWGMKPFETRSSRNDKNNNTAPKQRLLQRQQKHHGGRFNNFQVVPLSQGYGTHYTNIWVGSPTPQRKSVIVDTGSHYTAFPCTGCQNCGAEHHTDPYFDPSKSNTFHALTCDECKMGASCDAVNKHCAFSQSYTEGSSWEAIQVQDILYCGGSDVLDAANTNDLKYAIPFMFGCQTKETGLFVTQLADGIMGMSAHEATLAKQLYDHGKLEHNLFALCFRRELGTSKRGVTAGSMTLGGVDHRLNQSPMVYAKNMAQSGWFTVYVTNIFIRAGGGQSAKSFTTSQEQRVIKIPLDISVINSGKGVIVDSGTTDTYLHKKLAKSFAAVWKQVTGMDYTHAPVSLTPEQIRHLPTILVQCKSYGEQPDPSLGQMETLVGFAGSLDPSAPDDVLIAIPATNYMEYSPSTNLFTSRLYFTETRGGVLGANAMQGHNVVFDWENSRVGFAESTCEYEGKNRNVPSVDGFSTDCIVGEPILTKACVETVDLRICETQPKNVKVLGTEMWTRVVENPGTDSGMSCLDAIAAKTLYDGLEPPSIHCDGNGLCVETHACEMTCQDTVNAKAVQPAQSNPQNSNKCGESLWSACDYSCTQSKLESALFSDGHCHQVSLTSRPCHIGACGRSDPCRVPFIVQVITVLRGLEAKLWTKQSEDVFATALTLSVREMAGERALFDVGDVKILVARPWYAGDEDLENVDLNSGGATQELGLKVVAQISLFNSNAHVVHDVVTSTEEDTLMSTQQKFTAMVKNFTSSFRRKRSSQTVCHDADLYPLAKDAVLIAQEILGRQDFMKHFVRELQNVESSRGPLEGKPTPFTPIYNHEPFVAESRVVSAWTIRTQVDDKINFMGPPGSFRHLLLMNFMRNLPLFLGLFFFFFSIFSIGARFATALSLSNVVSEVRSRIPYPRRWRHYYSPVSKDTPLEDEVEIDDEDSVMEKILGGPRPSRRGSLNGGNLHNSSNGLEMTAQAPLPYNEHRTAIPKRRNSMTSSTQ